MTAQIAGTSHLVAIDETGSTNSDAKNMARGGAAHGTTVWARRQTAGKGRQGNSWVSESGNLYMSVILRPDVSPQDTGQLSFVISVALAEMVSALGVSGVALKWPNDLLIDGKKAAGILLESETGWVVAGIGVNIAHAPEGATCLRNSGTDITVEKVLEKLYLNIMHNYNLWQNSGFEPVRKKWMTYACKLGEIINVRLPKETFSATFVGIDHTGALQVEMKDGGKRLISSGEVFGI